MQSFAEAQFVVSFRSPFADVACVALQLLLQSYLAPASSEKNRKENI